MNIHSISRRGSLTAILLAALGSCAQEEQPPEPANPQGKAAAANPAEVPKNESQPAVASPKEHPRFPKIDPKHIPLLEEIDRQNPKLVPAWSELRELQAEWNRLFTVYGKVERKNAERAMAAVERSIERARRNFLAEYERIRTPWISQEDNLRTKALRLTERPPERQESKQQERDAEIAKLYMDALAIHERISALAQLDKAVTIIHPPTRMDHLGMTRGSNILKSLTKPDIDVLLPVHLALRDALADIAALEKRKQEDAANWRGADAQQLAAAERDLERAAQMVTRTLDNAKKPHEAQKLQAQRSLDSLNRRRETAQKGNRSTDRLDSEARTLTRQVELAEEKIAAIDAFGEWPKIREAIEKRSP